MLAVTWTHAGTCHPQRPCLLVGNAHQCQNQTRGGGTALVLGPGPSDPGSVSCRGCALNSSFPQQPQDSCFSQHSASSSLSLSSPSSAPVPAAEPRLRGQAAAAAWAQESPVLRLVSCGSAGTTPRQPGARSILGTAELPPQRGGTGCGRSYLHRCIKHPRVQLRGRMRSCQSPAALPSPSVGAGGTGGSLGGLCGPWQPGQETLCSVSPKDQLSPAEGLQPVWDPAAGLGPPSVTSALPRGPSSLGNAAFPSLSRQVPWRWKASSAPLCVRL